MSARVSALYIFNILSGRPCLVPSALTCVSNERRLPTAPEEDSKSLTQTSCLLESGSIATSRLWLNGTTLLNELVCLVSAAGLCLVIPVD